MKILFYNHTGQVGGAECLLLMILERIDRDSFDPIVVCPAQNSLSTMVSRLGVPVETVAGLEARFTWRADQFLRYFKSFLQVINQVRKKIISINPDLIHANSIRAGLVATAATFGLGTRVVWHLHDLLPPHPLSTLIRLVALFASRARMIAVSQAVNTNFRGRFSRRMKGRVSVILNAIDLTKFQPDATARQEIRAELQLGEAEFVIGIVGRLTPGKGQLELLRAFAQVRKEIPGASLLIVGAPVFNREHEYLQLLKQTSLDQGIAERVRITGARSDIGRVMQAFDLAVINSSVESFCLVALEAMACGTPVLAAASGGISEIIEHGKTGWLLPTRDEGALANAIIHLSRHPELCARLAEQGRRHVTARFSADRYIGELQAFYRSNSDSRSTQSLSTRSVGMNLARPFKAGNGQRAFSSRSDD